MSELAQVKNKKKTILGCWTSSIPSHSTLFITDSLWVNGEFRITYNPQFTLRQFNIIIDEKSTSLMAKAPISMAIFNSELLVITRVYHCYLLYSPLFTIINHSRKSMINNYFHHCSHISTTTKMLDWLVVSTPLKNISQMG